MIYDKILHGEQVSLRALKPEDCTDIYVGWLNDVNVYQHLETRWEEQNIETIQNFVNSIIDSDHSYIFAIIENSTNSHIGNIKLGPIHPRNNYADIGYFIGERDVWGKGYATEAVKLIVDFGFNILKLHRIQAGLISGNDSSSKVLVRNGFIKEGELKEKIFFNGEYRNHIMYGLVNNS